MKIILAVDAIQNPLTGIGRYALELANGLQTLPDIESLRFFSRGRFLREPGKRGWSPNIDEKTPSLKRRLAGSQLVSSLYRLVSPAIQKVCLSSRRDHLFHSPNYYLPPFDGKSVATFHDLSIYRYPEYHPPERVSFMEKQIPLSLKRADHIVTVSDFSRDEVIDYLGMPEEKVTAIPNGVSSKYRPYKACEIGDVLSKRSLLPDNYSLCVSTIEPRKNILGLLNAFSCLPEALQRRWPLVLVGSRGWRSEKIHERIGQMEEKGSVRYLGYVSEDALPMIFAGARAFFFPSFYEGFGLPVLEAMACGVPVMTSNCSSLPEVAGGAAYLVDPRDEEGLKEGIQRVLEDESWRETSIREGLEVAQSFTWSKTLERTVEVYHHVAG